MKIVGLTEDSKQVVDGIFKFEDTHGVPLQDTLEKLTSLNLVVSWEHYAKDAFNAGWTKHKTQVKVREAINDIFGRDYWIQLETKLNMVLDNVWGCDACKSQDLTPEKKSET